MTFSIANSMIIKINNISFGFIPIELLVMLKITCINFFCKNSGSLFWKIIDLLQTLFDSHISRSELLTQLQHHGNCRSPWSRKLVKYCPLLKNSHSQEFQNLSNQYTWDNLAEPRTFSLFQFLQGIGHSLPKNSNTVWQVMKRANQQSFKTTWGSFTCYSFHKGVICRM